MVKCSECGFLASRNVHSRQLEETEQEIRDNGCSVVVWNTGKPINVFEPPVCFMRIVDYKAFPYQLRLGKYTYPEVVAEIQRDRDCADFIKWQQGFTPKEHREMLDRAKWLEWQTEQRKSDRRWRIIELVVLGIVAALIAGAFTILGAFIERGSLFP